MKLRNFHCFALSLVSYKKNYVYYNIMNKIWINFLFFFNPVLCLLVTVQTFGTNYNNQVVKIIIFVPVV